MSSLHRHLSLSLSHLRSVLASLALAAFVVAPAFQHAVHTAGSNWN